ncbi:ENTH domain-containing protein 1 [Tupaia chinensis]|uniref:ENTH domain-containing protein 1 n=1 Tax=Tupaia chinensis TaxID=246437 RepID=L9KPS8_TUPCH|nr:ENTH domain-containing protein 1 [Tupaia chinensis]
MAFRRQVKNFVKNYSDAEIKVREATSNDPWGPSSSLMLDISDLTFNTISLSEIMNMLWHRLNDHGKNWRHVYKSLTLMDYLIKNGSKKVIQHCREGFYNLQILKDFQHIDEAGKDQGHYIREKSKQVITLLMDEQLLYKEREVACRTRRRTSYSMTFPKRLPGTGNSLTACASAPTQEIPDSEKKQTLLKVVRLRSKNALPTPSENSPSLQTNVSLDKTSDGTITNTVIENPSQTPLEKQLAAKSCETLTTLPALWPLSKEEFMNTHLRISKSDSTFSNHASVETLYVSPSFKTFDPAKETPVNKNHQKPTQPSIVQKNDENFKTLTTWVSTTSEGTSSFSTLSMSSPESASPEKSVHLLPPVLARPSFWTLSQQQLSSASFEERDTTTRVHHLFASRGPLSFDEEENDNFNLEILPDNSDSAKKKTNLISSSNWIDFSTQNVDQFTAMSCSSFQTTKGLPREPEANNSIKVLLQEVKNAIVKLHEDLSVVIQELKVINSHLVNMSGNSRQRSQSLPVPPSSKGSSDKT